MSLEGSQVNGSHVNSGETDSWQNLRTEVGQQLEQTRQQLKEINLFLEQSQIEVNRLTHRNATATGNLQKIHAHFDSLPREEIRAAYEATLDTQQRLFIMRGQLEKLQSDQIHLQRQLTLLDQLSKLMENGQSRNAISTSRIATVEFLEMLIQAQEAERQRLSRQMHDGPAQTLSNLILETEIAMRLFDVDQAKAYEELVNLKNSATATFQQVRDYIFELRPMMLDDLGLIPTIKKYTSAIKEQSGIDIHLAMTGTERRLESYLEVMIFRAVQELLSNAVDHSQASQVKIQVDLTDTEVRVAVEDNGRGFDTGGLDREQGMGLKVIQERVGMVGGTFKLDSQVGDGTRVQFVVEAVTPALDN